MIILAVLIAWICNVFPALDFTNGQWLLLCLVAVGLKRDW